MCGSIGWTIVFSHPCLEHLFSLCYVYMKRGYGPFGIQSVDLLIYEGVVETYSGSIMTCVCVIDRIWTSPVNGSKTHGAWFATCVEYATVELVCLEVCTGIANSLDLGMRCWIVCGDDTVVATSYNFAVFDDHAAERATVRFLEADGRELDGLEQEAFMLIHNLRT